MASGLYKQLRAACATRLMLPRSTTWSATYGEAEAACQLTLPVRETSREACAVGVYANTEHGLRLAARHTARYGLPWTEGVRVRATIAAQYEP